MKQGIFRHHKAQTQRKPILQLLVFTHFTVQWGINFKMSSLRSQNQLVSIPILRIHPDFLSHSFFFKGGWAWGNANQRHGSLTNFTWKNARWSLWFVHPIGRPHLCHWLCHGGTTGSLCHRVRLLGGGAPGWGVRDFHQTVIRIKWCFSNRGASFNWPYFISYFNTCKVAVDVEKDSVKSCHCQTFKKRFYRLADLFPYTHLGETKPKMAHQDSDLQIQF